MAAGTFELRLAVATITLPAGGSSYVNLCVDAASKKCVLPNASWKNDLSNCRGGNGKLAAPALHG